MRQNCGVVRLASTEEALMEEPDAVVPRPGLSSFRFIIPVLTAFGDFVPMECPGPSKSLMTLMNARTLLGVASEYST